MNDADCELTGTISSNLVKTVCQRAENPPLTAVVILNDWQPAPQINPRNEGYGGSAVEFYLTYEGPLKSNGRIKDKQAIRKHFHPQLERLWGRPPLDISEEEANRGVKPWERVIEEVCDVRFAPLVTDKLDLVCELDIVLLWPDEPGGIIHHGGDIDNRLKTLFDALTCPDANQLETIRKDCQTNDPFFCLLKDDKLVTGVNVRTHTWLRSRDNSDVYVLLHVKVRPTTARFDTLGFF